MPSSRRRVCRDGSPRTSDNRALRETSNTPRSRALGSGKREYKNLGANSSAFVSWDNLENDINSPGISRHAEEFFLNTLDKTPSSIRNEPDCDSGSARVENGQFSRNVFFGDIDYQGFKRDPENGRSENADFLSCDDDNPIRPGSDGRVFTVMRKSSVTSDGSSSGGGGSVGGSVGGSDNPWTEGRGEANGNDESSRGSTVMGPSTGNGGGSGVGSSSPWKEGEGEAAGKDELLEAVKVPERENQRPLALDQECWRLQDKVDPLKDRSNDNAEKAQEKLSQSSELRSQPERTEFKAVELGNASREVIGDSLGELSVAYESRGQEVAPSGEKPGVASKEIEANEGTVQELGSNMGQQEKTIQKQEGKNEQQTLEEYESLEVIKKSDENNWAEDKRRFDQEAECAMSAYSTLEERLKLMCDRLSSVGSQNNSLRVSSKKPKQEEDATYTELEERLKHTREQLSNTMSQNRSLQATMEEIKQQRKALEEIQGRLSNTQEKLSNTEIENRSLQATIEEMKQLGKADSELESQNRSLQESAEQTKQEGEEDISAVNKSLREAHERNEKKSEKLSGAMQDNHILTNTIGKMEENVAKLEMSLSFATDQHRKATERVTYLEAENGRLSKTINENKEHAWSAYSKLEERLINLSETLSSVENRNHVLEASMKKRKHEEDIAYLELEERFRHTRDKLSNAESQNRNLQASIEEIKQQGQEAHSELEVRLRNMADKLSNTEIQNHSLQEIVKKAKQKSEQVILAVNESSRQAQEGNQVFTEKLSSAMRDNHSLTNTIDEKEESIKLTTSLAFATNQQHKDTERVTCLEAENGRLIATIDKNKDAIKQLELALSSSKVDMEQNFQAIIEEIEHQGKVPYSELEERLKNMVCKLTKTESRNHSLKESIEKAKQEGEEVITAVNKSLREAQEENQTLSEKLISALQDNHSLTQTIEEKEESIAKLATSLAFGTDQHGKATERVTYLEVENGRLNTTIDKNKEAINELELALSASKVDADRQLNNVEAVLESVTKRLEGEKEVEVSKLEGMLKAIQAKLEERLRHTREKLSDTESKNCDLQATIKEINQKGEVAYSELEERLRYMSGKLSNTVSQNRSLQESVKKTKQESEEVIATVNKSLRGAQEENQTLSEKLSGAMRDNNSLTKTIDENERNIAKLETSLVCATDQHHKATEIVTNLEAEISRLNTTIDENKEAINKLELALSTSKLDAEKQLNNADAVLKSKVKRLREEKEVTGKLEKKVEAIEEEKQRQALQIEKLTVFISESKTKHGESEAALKSLIRAVEETNAEINSKFSAAEKEINALEEKVQSRDKQLMDMQMSTEMMKKEVETYKGGKLPTCEAAVIKLKAEFDCASANLREYATKASIMNQQISFLQSELLNANEQLNTSNDCRTKLQQKIESQVSDAKGRESKLIHTVERLKLELYQAKKDLEQSNTKLNKAKRESNTSNIQLKSALQSVDDMMKYIENMKEENDDAVTSLEGELEKAIEMKHDAEREMKRRIRALEKNGANQKEAMRLESDATEKRLKELEACRLDAIKELSRAKDDHRQKIAEMRQMYETEHGHRISQCELVTLLAKKKLLTELKTCCIGAIKDDHVKETAEMRQRYETACESKISECELLKLDLKNLQAKSSNYLSELKAQASRIESLTIDMDKLREQNNTDAKLRQDLEVSLKERSFQVESLMRDLNKLQDKTHDDEKIKQERESSLSKSSSQGGSPISEFKSSKLHLKDLQAKFRDDLSELKGLSSLSSQIGSLTPKPREKSNTDEIIEEGLQLSLKERSFQVESLVQDIFKLWEESYGDGKSKQKLKWPTTHKQSSKLKQSGDQSNYDVIIEQQLKALIQQHSSQFESMLKNLVENDTYLRQRIKSKEVSWSKKSKKYEDELSQVNGKLAVLKSELVKEKSQLEKLGEAKRKKSSLHESFEKAETLGLVSGCSDLAKGERQSPEKPTEARRQPPEKPGKVKTENNASQEETDKYETAKVLQCEDLTNRRKKILHKEVAQLISNYEAACRVP